MDFFAAAWNSAQWTLDARFAGAHGRREFEAEGLGSERGRFALGHGDRFGTDRLGGEVELGLRGDWLALLVELWRLGTTDGGHLLRVRSHALTTFAQSRGVILHGGSAGRAGRAGGTRKIGKWGALS